MSTYSGGKGIDMKAFLWVVLISFLGLCGYYYFKAFIIPDETQMLSIAFGNTTDDEVELHVEVTLVMAQLDVFPYMSMNGGTDWKAWANDHYIVKDDAGNQVEFTKRMKSNVISERDSRVVADGYLIAKLSRAPNTLLSISPSSANLKSSSMNSARRPKTPAESLLHSNRTFK